MESTTNKLEQVRSLMDNSDDSLKHLPQHLQWDKHTLRINEELGQWVRALQTTLPKNDSGLVTAYVDPERVARTGLLGDIQHFVINCPDDAIISLEFSEGFPTVHGIPFWERIDGELIPYFNLFREYRDLVERQGSRSLQQVASEQTVPIRIVRALRDIYHWDYRAAAFDRWMDEQREMMRQQQAKMMENEHFQEAQEIFQICTQFIKENYDMLDPKEARLWFETAAKLQRLSVGKSPDKPENESSSPNVSLTQINASMNAGKSSGNDEFDASNMESVLQILTESGALSGSKGDKNEKTDDNSPEEGELIELPSNDRDVDVDDNE